VESLARACAPDAQRTASACDESNSSTCQRRPKLTPWRQVKVSSFPIAYDAATVGVRSSRVAVVPLTRRWRRVRYIDRTSAAPDVYDEPVVRPGDSELAIREQVAKALANKAFTLGELNRAADALAVYDDVVARFGDAPEPAIREQVAKALANKAFTLGQLNRAADALAAYDELVVRFGDAPEPNLREQVAKALVNKAITLGRLERPAEALATYDEVIARFEIPRPVSTAELNALVQGGQATNLR
jgi:tetratricopeptide (TPR) repeat protein